MVVTARAAPLPAGLKPHSGPAHTVGSNVIWHDWLGGLVFATAALTHVGVLPVSACVVVLRVRVRVRVRVCMLHGMYLVSLGIDVKHTM